MKKLKPKFITFLLLAIVLIVIALTTIMSSKKIESISIQQVQKDLELNQNLKVGVFSGGCFWCVESDFEKLEGVKYAISGYTSNSSLDTVPTYREVAKGSTNFRESVLVVYDSSKLEYKDLVKYFLVIHDPTDFGGSFYDRGFQYSSAIYYRTNEEEKIIREVILETQKSFEKPIITSIEKFVNFYEAEEYHQDYYKKNSLKYSVYRKSSGREDFVNSLKEKFNNN